MATLLKTGGTSETVKPRSGKAFHYTEIQQLVGGDIEAFYLSEKEIMFFNEEGKLLDLPVNLGAMEELDRRRIYLGWGNVIVGDAIMTTIESGDEEDEDGE